MGRELVQDQASRGLTEEGIVHIPGLMSRWVLLANGEKAHYVTSGDTGPAVILLHGGIEGSSGTAGWRFMAPVLGANGFRVYCPDRPGFGLADTARTEFLEQGPIRQVEFVRMFADALGLDKFHISGNSAGCAVSVNFVVTYPERILSVAFIAGGLGDITDTSNVSDKREWSANPTYERNPYDGTEKAMKELMEGIIYEAKTIWPELITMRVNASLKQRAPRGISGVAQGPRGGAQGDPSRQQVYSTTGRLDKLSTPMIYMYGLQDVLSPVERGFAQEDSVPNVQFFYPNHCGHQGQTDQPDMFNQTFLEFFRDGKVSWKTAEWAGVSRRTAINAGLVEEPAAGFPKPDAAFLDQFKREAMAAAKV
jgi:2-hydroxy-6-oxonona-2,4-dienedioate hydrolase